MQDLRDESWEFQNNTSNRMLFKSADFETMYTDPETLETRPEWKNDFEARFPDDTWDDVTQLKTFMEWIVSTNRDRATGDDLPETVTYGGTQYTKDTAEYRLAKFSAEISDYAQLDSLVFYYIFTEVFLMVDSRAKNLFIGFHGSESPIEGIRRKLVAEPYDMDTAMGTNNEGTLTFGYSLEDTDQVNGANVFNGQESVLWCNLRDTKRAQIVQMYQSLRSSGALSAEAVEARFEEAQSKWPEALWMEDAQSKYIEPLVNPEVGKEPTDFYLPMHQGSKEQQRKWWLPRRFAYMDSKWNAGDALSKVIQLRGYAKADISVTPYIDLYPTVKYGSYLTQKRGKAGAASLLECPMDNVDDTEIYIYSAPWISNLGDLSGLKVGVADFSQAVNIQAVKVGDSDSSYTNNNMKTLSFGNNVLLRIIDARNCAGLGTAEQKSVDVSNCAVLEEAYFEGTSIQGLTLPNGGVLKGLHLPETMTNLTVLNQKNITDFVIGSYDNISTLRIENSSLDTKAIIKSIPAGARVRLIGIAWECENAAEIEDLLDILDTMRGLSENGTNMDTAQVSGTIHTNTLTGSQVASYNERYPYINIVADHVTSYLTYANYDGSNEIKTVTCLNGVPQESAPSGPSRDSTAANTFAFIGWSKKPNSTTVDDDAAKDVIADRTIYAVYEISVRTYTVTFVRASADGGGTLYTQNNVTYGTTPTYGGSTPTTTKGDVSDYPFEGWTPALAPVNGSNLTYTAKFGSPIVEITDSWDTIIANIDNGTYKTKYKIGNYKPLDLGTEGTVNMQIVGIDVDELADGSGKAPLTFIGLEFLNTLFAFNDRNSANYDYANWGISDIRGNLRGTVYNKIPTTVRNRICGVKKDYNYWTSSSDTMQQGTITDTIWLPSVKEISNLIWTGNGGIYYNKIFPSSNNGNTNAERIRKSQNGTVRGWWTRSAYQVSTYKSRVYIVDNTGKPTATYPSDPYYGSLIGFCLGKEQEA